MVSSLKIAFIHLHMVFLSLIILSNTSMCFAEEKIDKEREVSQRSAMSVHGRVGRAWLPEVTIIAPNDQASGERLSASLESSIREQLSYVVGNLHGIEGGLSLHRAEISDVLLIETLGDGQARYQYSASFEAIISKTAGQGAAVIDQYQVILPERVNEAGLLAFFEATSDDCTPNPHQEYQVDHYWYYFRPLAYYCPLSTAGAEEEFEALLVNLYFEEEVTKDNKTSPHYDELWRDGKLEVTAVYALVGGLLAEQGQEAYQQVFEDLQRTYGTPSYIQDEALLNAQWLETDTPVIHATFDTPRGPLEVHLFLINSLDVPSHQEGDPLKDFHEEYKRLTQVSDFMIYNGHARYGSDNAKLDALGGATSNHYQLFFVNTCASYTYGLPRYRGIYQEANLQADNPDAFLDLVLNAMPAMGHEIAYMNGRFIHALVEAEESYESILSTLYPKQQMLVLPGGRGDQLKGDLAQIEGESTSPWLVINKDEAGSGCDLTPFARSPFAKRGYLSSILMWCFIAALFFCRARYLRSRIVKSALNINS